MKTVYEAANALEAHMLADVLKQEGITAQVMGSFLPGAMGELPAAGLVRLVVEEDDFDQARAAIGRWELSLAGLIVGGEHDRNFDSRMDLRLHYGASGELDAEERDDDFDGQFESRTTYRMNLAQRTEADTDGDRLIDSITHFMHGVATRMDTLEPRSGKPVRIEHLHLGRLDKVERDTDLDGAIDTREHYNALGQITRTERIAPPP